MARADTSGTPALLAQGVPAAAADWPGEWLPVSGNAGRIRFPPHFPAEGRADGIVALAGVRASS